MTEANLEHNTIPQAAQAASRQAEAGRELDSPPGRGGVRIRVGCTVAGRGLIATCAVQMIGGTPFVVSERFSLRLSFIRSSRRRMTRWSGVKWTPGSDALYSQRTARTSRSESTCACDKHISTFGSQRKVNLSDGTFAISGDPDGDRPLLHVPIGPGGVARTITWRPDGRSFQGPSKPTRRRLRYSPIVCRPLARRLNIAYRAGALVAPCNKGVSSPRSMYFRLCAT